MNACEILGPFLEGPHTHVSSDALNNPCSFHILCHPTPHAPIRLCRSTCIFGRISSKSCSGLLLPSAFDALHRGLRQQGHDVLALARLVSYPLQYFTGRRWRWILSLLIAVSNGNSSHEYCQPYYVFTTMIQAHNEAKFPSSRPENIKFRECLAVRGHKLLNCR